MKPGDKVRFRIRDKWRHGTVDHVNPGDSLIVKADDEEMKYALHERDVEKRP